MMGVQIHAHAAQSSERALPAVRRLRINEHSADHDVRPEVYPFWPDVANARTDASKYQPGILSGLAPVNRHHFRVVPEPIPIVINRGHITAIHIRDGAGNFVETEERVPR